MNPNQRARRAAAWLPAFLFLATLTVYPSPVGAETRLASDPLEPGMYDGTFTFTIKHEYNRPTQDMPVNMYLLSGESALGTIRFKAEENGRVSGISIRVPGFSYTATNSQTVIVPKDSQGEYHCTGNSAKAVGMGTVSGGSGAVTAPPLTPSNISFYTKPVRFDAGDPWGRVNLIGSNCPVKADSRAFVEAVKADINSLPTSPWTFRVEWQALQSAGGSCSNESWNTADRSISCFWAAYSNGYTRKTAPGP